MSRFTCTYPAEAIRVADEIYEVLKPLVDVLESRVEPPGRAKAEHEAESVKNPTSVRIAKVIRSSSPMSSSKVAKLADTTAATVRNSKPWKNRKVLWNTAGRLRKGSKGKNGAMEAYGTEADSLQPEHYDIYQMFQDYKSGKTDKPPTTKQIAEKLTTDDDVVSEERAKQLLKEARSYFSF